MLLKFENISPFVQENILPILKKHKIFAFVGPLGAGKTTLIREILHQAGVIQPITSPTFGYVKSYTSTDGRHYHHFDLYRINSLESFISAGFDEYLNQENSTSLIEWPSVIDQLLTASRTTNNVVNITLDYLPIDQSTRTITITPHPR